MKNIFIFSFLLCAFSVSAQFQVSNGQQRFFTAYDTLIKGDCANILNDSTARRADNTLVNYECDGVVANDALPGDTVYLVFGGTILNFPRTFAGLPTLYLSDTSGQITNTPREGQNLQVVGKYIGDSAVFVFIVDRFTPAGLGTVTAVDNISNTPIGISGESGGPAYIKADNITAVRNQQLANKDGTFAMLDDVSALDLQTVCTVGNLVSTGVKFRNSPTDEGYVELNVDPVSAPYTLTLPQTTGTIATTITATNTIYTGSGFDLLTVGTYAGTEPEIKFLDPVSENFVRLRVSSGLGSSYIQSLPAKNGTIAVTADITDTSPTNEIQNLSLTGQSLGISSGSGVTLPVVGITAGSGISVSSASGNYTISASGGSGDISNGGNTTGATVTIGTNDANALEFETNNVVRQSITGGASTGGAQTFTDITANTSTVESAVTVRTNSSGTAAAGFGARLLYQLESTTTDNQDAGAIGAIWTTATHASRTSALQFSGVNNAGSLGEFARFEGATAPVLKIASAVGTAGTTTYSNAGITTGTAFTLGGSSNSLNIGTSSGNVNIYTNGSFLNDVTIGGNQSHTFTGLGKTNVAITGNTYTASSGSGTLTALLIANTYNLTSTASGVQQGIYINPTLTSIVGGYRSIDIAANNSNAKGIYQSGSSTTNNLVGKTTFGATTAPTALVMLAAGTATANTAPLKFTSGTNLTTVENGAVEYDGTDYFASSGSTRYVLARTLRGSATLDFASTAAGTSTDLTVTVTGAADGDVVSIGVPNGSTVANGLFTAWVSATNTVTVRFSNNGLVSALDPASGTFKVSVSK